MYGILMSAVLAGTASAPAHGNWIDEMMGVFGGYGGYGGYGGLPGRGGYGGYAGYGRYAGQQGPQAGYVRFIDHPVTGHPVPVFVNAPPPPPFCCPPIFEYLPDADKVTEKKKEKKSKKKKSSKEEEEIQFDPEKDGLDNLSLIPSQGPILEAVVSKVPAAWRRIQRD